MTKKIKFLTILLAFIAQSTIMWAECTGTSPVQLSYRNMPKVKGTVNPTKAPAHLNPTISAYLNEECKYLDLDDFQSETISYNIYNSDGEEVGNGSLCLLRENTVSIYLGMLKNGVYTIDIVGSNIIYEGTFLL